MKNLHIQINQFQDFILLVRQNVVIYSEIIHTFDSFKSIDNCFLALQSACCGRRAEILKDCEVLMKNFVLDEKNKAFFSFFKEKYYFGLVVFLDGQQPVASF